MRGITIVELLHVRAGLQRESQRQHVAGVARGIGRGGRCLPEHVHLLPVAVVDVVAQHVLVGHLLHGAVGDVPTLVDQVVGVVVGRDLEPEPAILGSTRGLSVARESLDREIEARGEPGPRELRLNASVLSISAHSTALR